MKVTRTSIHSNITRTLELDITPQQLEDIEQKRGHIQNIVPHLTADQREFLLTGLYDGEFEQLFGSEDEEEIEDIGNEDDMPF